ncbi:MAG: SpoIID/LytB domain-containing protein [Deltaproteobacteria bacterium]|nr:SpoIID/LytB domain-containing protein [Deltaproteobacteria bacterium]
MRHLSIKRRLIVKRHLIIAASAFCAALPAQPAHAAEIDRLPMLYSSQVMFQGGIPIVTIMLMEGRDSVSFSADARLKITLYGGQEKTVDSPPRKEWTARVKDSKPARVAWRPIVAEVPFNEKDLRAEAEKTWAGRGFAVKTFTVGSVFGIAGRVYDNRTYVVTVVSDKDEDRERSVMLSSDLFKKFGVRVSMYPEVLERPSGAIEFADGSGKAIGEAKDLAGVVAEGDDGILVRKIEHGVGYPWHGFEDRRYQGEILLVLDRAGRLAVVNSIAFPKLLKGLVPSEIFASAHHESLKAQAVAARSEILAKIGHRHPGNAYLLCAEQHCQVYSGRAREYPETNRAVEATEGEVLVTRGRIVGAVYSSHCGGHTENNDVAWEQQPDPALRGKPDLPEGGPSGADRKEITTEKKLHAWLSQKPDSWCARSSYGKADSLRWKTSLSAPEVDRLVNARYKIGRVKDVKVVGRGVSGRVTGVKIVGETGSAHVGREFPVRQLFGGLKSGMFALSIERGADGWPVRFAFRGGGWGHGVGMCQTGAIGMAEAGLDYRAILRHYYSGADIANVYGAPAREVR